jgi:hypothetical protein
MSTEVLVNSPEYDKLFSDLCRYLDQCSLSRGDCEGCQLCQACRDAFDSLSNEITHYKLTPEVLTDFKRKYNGLSKQLTFC